MGFLEVRRLPGFDNQDTKRLITLTAIFYQGLMNSDLQSPGLLMAFLLSLNMVVFLFITGHIHLGSPTTAEKPHRYFEFLYSGFPVTGRTAQLQGRNLIPPFNVSQWEKGECIGSGSSGKVYLASNKSGERCAIKEVQVMSNDTHSERLKQLKQEIFFLEQLRHPNIVQYRGSILNGDVLSVYTEYASKGSIHDLLRKDGPFEEYRIRYVTKEILSGLAYLHGNNIVHRDIKGANILVTASGEVKLADFGLAKQISFLAEVHSSDKGTVYWMAPELILSKHSRKGYNVAVDIWSLGCIIIEMATARHPWSQYDAVQAMHKIAFTEDIPEIPESLSTAGKEFVQLCLQRVVAFRPTAIGLMNHDFIKNHGRASFSQMRVRHGKSLKIC